MMHDSFAAMTVVPPPVSFSLTVKDASAAIALYTEAFGAVEVFRMPDPSGGTAHAEFTINGQLIYISDEAPEWSAMALPEGMLAPCLFTIETDDCDGGFARGEKAGLKVLTPPTDNFWGSRSCMFLDPYGYRWCLNQKTEDLTPDEVMARAAKLFGGE